MELGSIDAVCPRILWVTVKYKKGSTTMNDVKYRGMKRKGKKRKGYGK